MQPNQKMFEGELYIIASKKLGYEFLPCIPSRQGDDTCELPDGVLLLCLGFKETQPGCWLYEMEVSTGKKAGDLIYIIHQVADFLERVPNHKRIR